MFLLQRSWELPELLRQRLTRPLPGSAAQRQFAPPLSYGRHRGPASPDATAAAVLLLLIPDQSLWRLPLTARPVTLAHHAGQVSLPGGCIERGETVEETALRECEEELGVPVDEIRLLGRLTPLYIYHSNFLVTPCVGYLSERCELRPNPSEVRRLLEPSLDELWDPRHHGVFSQSRGGFPLPTPCIRFADQVIWGATSMVLAEFFAVLESLAAFSAKTKSGSMVSDCHV